MVGAAHVGRSAKLAVGPTAPTYKEWPRTVRRGLNGSRRPHCTGHGACSGLYAARACGSAITPKPWSGFSLKAGEVPPCTVHPERPEGWGICRASFEWGGGG